MSEELNIEFEQIVGSIGWAYEVAKREGTVWHKFNIGCAEEYKLCEMEHDLIRKSWDGEYISVKKVATLSACLTGWSRKVKTDKELMIGEVMGKLKGHNLHRELFDEIFIKYEVKKNE